MIITRTPMRVSIGGGSVALATGEKTSADSASTSAIQHPIKRPRERKPAEPFMACMSHILLIRAEPADSDVAMAQPLNGIVPL